MLKRFPLKKLFTIFLFLALTAPFTVTYTWLHFQKKQVKKEIKEKIISGMDKNDLVLLKFTKIESNTILNWHHSGEFQFKSQMYDVVHVQYHGDSVFYWCWHDRKEMKLNKQMDNLVAQALGNSPQNREHQKRISKYFKVHFLTCKDNWQPHKDFHKTPLISEYISFYSSIHSKPPAPPPKSFL